jgi:hypothetical protein
VKSNSFFALIAVAVLFQTAAVSAASVDMADPRRALGREDDVRVDAQLIRDTVSPGGNVGITYQIQNLSSSPVAIAEKVCDLSYDSETATITLGVGSEVPDGGVMPRMVVIPPGEKKTFTTGAVLRVVTPSVRTPWSIVPRLVQIKVTVLRELSAFTQLIQRQTADPAPIVLSDNQFEKWLESNDTIFLNPVPVRFDPRRNGGPDVDSVATAIGR